MQSRLIRLIGVVFPNCRMLLVSDKSDSINEHTQDNNKIKLHILGPLQNDEEFIRQLGGYSLSSVARTPRLMLYDIMLTGDTTYSR